MLLAVHGQPSCDKKRTLLLYSPSLGPTTPTHTPPHPSPTPLPCPKGRHPRVHPLAGSGGHRPHALLCCRTQFHTHSLTHSPGGGVWRAQLRQQHPAASNRCWCCCLIHQRASCCVGHHPAAGTGMCWGGVGQGHSGGRTVQFPSVVYRRADATGLKRGLEVSLER